MKSIPDKKRASQEQGNENILKDKPTELKTAAFLSMKKWESMCPW